MSEKIIINPLTRISGFLQIEITIENNLVTEAKNRGFLFRGFEEMLKGRSPLDAIYFTERICGICSTAHGFVSAIALEDALKVKVDENGTILREIMHGCEFLQNHIRHFYQFTMPDYAKIDAVSKDEERKYKVTKDYTKIFNRHYMESFKYSRDAHKMLAILGGKAPHNHGIFVGGATINIDASRIIELKALLNGIKTFVNTAMLPDVRAISYYYKEDFVHGHGYTNFLSYGAFDSDVHSDISYVKAGTLIDDKLEPFDASKISEEISHSYYSDEKEILSQGDNNWKVDVNKKNAYTWVKAARYRNLPLEVGPLARQWISGEYKNGVSTMDRTIARVLEAKKICDILDKLIDRVKLTPTVQEKWEIPDSAKGIGLRDTTRGALGHWINIEGKKIANYNIITPSGWNISPTDLMGRNGVVEKALIGTFVEDVKNPYELSRIIRSFDPCVSCATHIISDKYEDFIMRIV
ncbi:nickel-dependent hydrogenase large subunit [Clostridium cellulovorans]|uniref:Nickel-dependent hydrogenase large subunit n=1 Tax=Clostridium cellulovorans (strain ATCC 35296 / DSM 3052 / OCM 3 / 743B) TaxID=573061 RepID=D9SUK7_CLOC7|nr:nickel-dependent hydrogenase large subunit [Clostridium cellulovorans]ADL50912.1 nickel-dependent hydrogenase large subunit [Clostridium cellulovorans 743B]